MVSSMGNLFALVLKKRNEEFFSELLDKIDDIPENNADPVSNLENIPAKGLSSSKRAIFRRVLKHTILNAKKKNFERAEELRSYLYKINPKAVKEIFRTGQLIEIEKKKFDCKNKNQTQCKELEDK